MAHSFRPSRPPDSAHPEDMRREPPKDFRLFERAVTAERSAADITIEKVRMESVGYISFGGRPVIHNGALAAAESRQSFRPLPDPKEEILRLAHEISGDRWDMDKEVIGSGSPYVLLKRAELMSVIGLHCLFYGDTVGSGLASMVLMTNEDNVNQLFKDIIEDPVVIIALPMALFPIRDAGYRLSVSECIAIIHPDWSCEIKASRTIL